MVSPSDVALMPYIAVAHGAKRYNLAKIYAGHYKYKGDNKLAEYPDPVPIICIVKCGDEWEEKHPASNQESGKTRFPSVANVFCNELCSMNE